MDSKADVKRGEIVSILEDQASAIMTLEKIAAELGEKFSPVLKSVPSNEEDEKSAKTIERSLFTILAKQIYGLTMKINSITEKLNHLSRSCEL